MTITVKKELLKQKTKRKMLFRKFLLDYMYENWYLSSTVPLEMMGELPVSNIYPFSAKKAHDTFTSAK